MRSLCFELHSNAVIVLWLAFTFRCQVSDSEVVDRAGFGEDMCVDVVSELAGQAE